jgi:hypothetical protein
LIDAKTQEAEVGLKLLPQSEHPSKKKSRLKEAIQNQNESNMIPHSQEADTNTSFSKKFQSPVIYEMKKRSLRKNLPSDQDNKKNSRLEETIKDDFDQSIFNNSHRGAIFEKSFSVVSSLSLSSSKESNEKHKSSSLDRNCSFILRNERHLGKSGKNSGNNRSSNGSDSSQPNNSKEAKAITDSLKVIKIEDTDKEETKQAKTPAIQNLFALNNNVVIQPLRKESLEANKNQMIVEDATEDKNSGSGRWTVKEAAVKKENVIKSFKKRS